MLFLPESAAEGCSECAAAGDGAGVDCDASMRARHNGTSVELSDQRAAAEASEETRPPLLAPVADAEEDEAGFVDDMAGVWRVGRVANLRFEERAELRWTERVERGRGGVTRGVALSTPAVASKHKKQCWAMSRGASLT